MLRRLAALAVVAVLLLAAAPRARADRAAAKKLNGEGMSAYRKKAWSDAVDKYRAAIAADPEFVTAHYNLACALSLAGEVEPAMVELRWLAASSDAEAKAKIKKALTDPDLDFVSTLPEFRKLVGHPPWDEVAPLARMGERGGVWGQEGAFCAMPWTLVKVKGKSVTVQTFGGCNEDQHKTRDVGALAVEGDELWVSFKKAKHGLLPARAQVTFAPCEDQAGLTCASFGEDVVLSRGRPEREFPVPLK
jgi:hypothetical protein